MGVDLAEGARFALKHINPAVSRLAAAVSAMAAGDGKRSRQGKHDHTTPPARPSLPRQGATRGKQGQPIHQIV